MAVAVTTGTPAWKPPTTQPYYWTSLARCLLLTVAYSLMAVAVTTGTPARKPPTTQPFYWTSLPCCLLLTVAYSLMAVAVTTDTPARKPPTTQPFYHWSCDWPLWPLLNLVMTCHSAFCSVSQGPPIICFWEKQPPCIFTVNTMCAAHCLDTLASKSWDQDTSSYHTLVPKT